MIGKLFAGKALVAMATLALTATGAAAATGTLPTPVQGAVAGAVSHIGIDLPSTDTPAPAATDDEGEKGEVENSQVDDGQADDGEANDSQVDNDQVDNGQVGQNGHQGDDPAGHDANDDHGKGEMISGITHDPALDGQPKGPTVCEAASDGQCRAGEDHGNATGNGSDDSGRDDPATHDANDDHGGSHGDSSGSDSDNSGKGKSGK